MRNLLRKIQHEHSQGGIKHLAVGSIEKLFVSVLRRFPSVYWKVAAQYFRRRSSKDILKYQSSLDPFKKSYISPESIKYVTGREYPFQNRRLLFGKVTSGNWDKSVQRYSSREYNNTIYHQSMVTHFTQGVPWEETRFYQKSLNRLNKDTNDPRRYQNEQDLRNRVRKWDKLFERIKSEGYLSQEELLSSGEYNAGLFLDTLDEVSVDVGRNGELLFADGMHRLSIAKILDIEKIPVVFFVRHKEWMEYREKLCQNDEQIPDHPDLRDLK